MEGKKGKKKREHTFMYSRGGTFSSLPFLGTGIDKYQYLNKIICY